MTDNQKSKEIEMLKDFIQEKEKELLGTLSKHEEVKLLLSHYKFLYKLCLGGLKSISNGKEWYK